MPLTMAMAGALTATERGLLVFDPLMFFSIIGMESLG